MVLRTAAGPYVQLTWKLDRLETYIMRIQGGKHPIDTEGWADLMPLVDMQLL